MLHVQVYILVLCTTKVGLLGLAYVALLIWVFTYPPIRGRWGSLDEGGVQVSQQPQRRSGTHLSDQATASCATQCKICCITNMQAVN